MSNELQTTTQSNAISSSRYEPADLNQLLDFADRIIQSRLCPSHFQQPEDIVLVVQQGAALGVRAMTAIQNSHVIHGNVGWDADFMKGLCLRSGLVERWEYEVKNSNECVAIVQRKGNAPTTYRWTRKKAKHIGLMKNNVWKQYPDTMLKHRVDADAARGEFPDIISGVYTPEEIRHIEQTPQPSSVTVQETVEASVSKPKSDKTSHGANGHNGSSGQSVMAAKAKPAPDIVDAAPQSAPEPQEESGPDLSTQRRSLGQVLGQNGVPDEVKDAYRRHLVSTGEYHDAIALAEEVDRLKAADDKTSYCNQYAGIDLTPSADNTPENIVAWLEEQSGGWDKVIDRLRKNASDEAEVEACVVEIAADHQCDPPSLPKVADAGTVIHEKFSSPRKVSDFISRATDSIPH